MMGTWAMGLPIIMSFLDFGERSASSAPFPINSAERCNRVRLTSDGGFKTCLQYGETLDLRSLLRSGVSDTEIREQLEKEIQKKPQCHHFEKQVENIEKQNMSKIGG